MKGTTAPARPELAEQASQFMLLERAVEEEYRPRMRAELQRRVEAVAQVAQAVEPQCPQCGQPMRRQDIREVSWLARFGRLHARVSRYRCASRRVQAGPAGSVWGRARPHQWRPGPFVGFAGTVAPYPLAARWRGCCWE